MADCWETANWENGEVGGQDMVGQLEVLVSSRLEAQGLGLGLVSVLEAWVSVLVSVSDWRVLGASLPFARYQRSALKLPSLL